MSPRALSSRQGRQRESRNSPHASRSSSSRSASTSTNHYDDSGGTSTSRGSSKCLLEKEGQEEVERDPAKASRSQFGLPQCSSKLGSSPPPQAIQGCRQRRHPARSVPAHLGEPRRARSRLRAGYATPPSSQIRTSLRETGTRLERRARSRRSGTGVARPLTKPSRAPSNHDLLDLRLPGDLLEQGRLVDVARGVCATRSS